MVKRRKNNTRKKSNGKGFKENGTKARKINASTVYETCTEQLSPFGRIIDHHHKSRLQALGGNL